MIKRASLAVVLTMAYLLAFAAGSFLHPIGVVRALGSHGPEVRLFVWDGVLLMLMLYGLSLGVEAMWESDCGI